MKDPYLKLAEDINKTIIKLANMLDWIAKRTMTTKDYLEFVDEFAEKRTGQTDELLK